MALPKPLTGSCPKLLEKRKSPVRDGPGEAGQRPDDLQRVARQRHAMAAVGLEPLGRHGPQFRRQIEFRPARLRDLALALPGDEQQPHQRPIGISKPPGRLPEGAQLVVGEHALAGFLLADDAARLQAVARRGLQPVFAAIDRPVEEHADVPKNVTRLMRGRAVGDRLDQPHDVAAGDLVDLPVFPDRDQLAADFALDLRRPALAPDVPFKEILNDDAEAQIAARRDLLG